jgi:hypothetical protein
MRQEKKFGSGRTVPIDEFVAQHTTVTHSMRELVKHYEGNDNFHFGAIDNGGGPGEAKGIPLDNVPPPPDPEALRLELGKVLEDEYRAGRISRSIYEHTRRGSAGKEVGM